MGRRLGKVLLPAVLVAVLLGMPLLGAGCAREVGSPTEIVFGALLDFKGDARDTGIWFKKAFDDWVKYVNDNDLLPGGVKLKMEYYDTRYDIDRVPDGFFELKGKGAKVIFSFASGDAEAIMHHCKEHKILLLAGGATDDLLADEEGYVFSVGTRYEDNVQAFLHWLVEEGWDYEGEGRNPRIGAFGWTGTLGGSFCLEAKRYCTNEPGEKLDWVHPHEEDADKLDWVGEKRVTPGAPWTEAVRSLLKEGEADYLICGTISLGFLPFLAEMSAQEIRADATTLVLHDATVSSWPDILRNVEGKAEAEYIPGTYYHSGYSGWGEEGYPLIDLLTEIAQDNRPDEWENIRLTPSYRGGCYLALFTTEAVKHALEEVYAEYGVYDATKVTGELLWEKIAELDFTEGKQPDIFPESLNEPLKFTETFHQLVTHIKLFEWDPNLDPKDFKPISGFIHCPSTPH